MKPHVLSAAAESELFSSSQPSPHRVLLSPVGHAFEPHSFKKPTWDSFSGEFITGLHHQGLRCRLCSANVANDNLAFAKQFACVGEQTMTDDQHRRRGNFEKRRELMLVWKKTHLAIVGKDVIRMIDAMLENDFGA